MRSHRTTRPHVALLCSALLPLAACHRTVPVEGPPRDPADAAEARSTAALTDSRGPGEVRGATVAESSEWRGRPVARVEELLVGRFPGVQVLSIRGQGLSIRIRGTSTIVGNQEPLFVIDGLPIDRGPGGLVNINPNDVARIEVLKDVASTAFYGIRGANGVILITTKRNW